MTSKDKFTVSIEDPFLGKRELSQDNFEMELIKDQLKLLSNFRDDGRVPSQQLLNDIRVYEYILGSENPNETAKLYFQEKRKLEDERKTFGIDKSEVAKNLGWNIGTN